MDKENRFAVVTGGNAGIGFAVVDALLQNGMSVIFTSLPEEDGEKSLKKLSEKEKGKVFHHQLDLRKQKSVDKFSSFIKEKFGKIDTLVNNAGILKDGKEFAQDVIGTNYQGTKRMTMSMLPLMKSGGRIVFLSSQHSRCGGMKSTLKTSFLKCDSLDTLDSLMTTFLSDIKSGSLSQYGGFHRRLLYGISKLGINSLMGFLSRKNDDLFCFSVYPGWCRTAMGGDMAPRTAKKGAETVVWLVLNGKKEWSGSAFMDKRKASL